MLNIHVYFVIIIENVLGMIVGMTVYRSGVLGGGQ